MRLLNVLYGRYGGVSMGWIWDLGLLIIEEGPGVAAPVSASASAMRQETYLFLTADLPGVWAARRPERVAQHPCRTRAALEGFVGAHLRVRPV